MYVLKDKEGKYFSSILGDRKVDINKAFIFNEYPVREGFTAVKVSVKEAPKTYKRGDRFLVEGTECVLVQVDTKTFCLIDVKCSDRWSNPVKVNDVNVVTEEELNLLVDSSPYEQIN